MGVVGQMIASEEHFHGVCGMPTEQEIAKDVKTLPSTVMGKTMSENIIPCSEPGHVIKFSVEHGKSKFMSLTDTFSVQDTSTEEPFAGGVYVKEFTKLIGGNRIVIYDAHDKPIALAVQNALKMLDKKYTIYGTIPIYDTDKAEETEGGVEFFPWFRVADIDDSHLDFRGFLAWNGNNFQPMYRVVAALRSAETPKTAQLLPPRKGDNIVVDSKDPSIKLAMLSKKSAGNIAGWDVCVAPGVDPLAMLTLAVVMDAMVGWFA